MLTAVSCLVFCRPLAAGPDTNVCFLLVQQAASRGQQEQYRERQILDRQTDEWVEMPPEAAPPAPADELDQARSELAQNRPRQARKLLEKWIKANPDHERYYEAVFLLGEALFESGRYYQAYERYEQVVENTAGELFHAALRREMDVARAFLAGKKRIVWKILRLPAYDEALTILDRIWERVPGTRLAEEALRIKADYHYNKGEMDLAQDDYALLAREYPAGRFVQLSMLRSAQAAEAAFPGVKFDDRPLVEAQERYQQLAAAYPAYAERENVPQRLVGLREKRADKDLEVARWYERVRQKAAAEFYYRQILKQYPGTLAEAEARQRLRALGVEIVAEESSQ
jgi:outer membrane protein assembly factor BamD (BamD/ComL family)